MADAVTNYSALSLDALQYLIAEKMYILAEKNAVLGQTATKHNLPQRSGKTLRVDRYKRFNLPLQGGTLTEGTPPDAVAMSVEKVDVTVEQWGIVCLLTDVAEITTKHPALAIGTDRVSMAMREVIEREQGVMLLGGSQVVFGGAATTRTGLAVGDVLTSAVVLRATTTLRINGAPDFGGGQFLGVVHPQMEAQIQADTIYSNAAIYSQVERLNDYEFGKWAGVKWMRSNFLPYFKGVAAATSGAATSEKTQITVVDSPAGGTIASSTSFKFQIVGREITTDFERKISVLSANITTPATGNTEAVDFVFPTGGNAALYTYDGYMTTTAGAGSGALYKVISRAAAGSTVRVLAAPAGTEATAPTSPNTDIEVAVGFVFGKDAWGRVELDGMSLQSYITPPGSSYSNPLAQGRKMGAKVMWKSFLLDPLYFVRIEVGVATASAILPA